MREHYEGYASVGIVRYCFNIEVNMHKSVPISCIKRNLDDLGWIGVVVQHGMSCRHLGYPIDWDVPNSKS